MKLEIGPEIHRRLRGKSAAKTLALLESKAAAGQALPKWMFKRSGPGRNPNVAAFQPYVDLDLFHAKLDATNSAGGDPLLVFQQVSPGTYVAIGLSTHEAHATANHSRCWQWLWDNRGAIDWELGPATEQLHDELVERFGGDGPPPPGTR